MSSLREEAKGDLWLWNMVANENDTKNNSNELDEKENSNAQVWIQKNSFELKFRIEPSPFYCNNRIVFAADHSGIYELSLANDRCKYVYRFSLSGYSPTQYSYIYNETNNEIFFIGGRNSLNSNLFYDTIMVYNLNHKTMKQLSFNNRKIGNNSKSLICNNILHIIGGSHNKYHILYSLQTLTIKHLYQLPYPNGLMYHGLCYCKSQSTLLLFGGVFFNNLTKSLSYSNDFWRFNLVQNQWNKISNKQLPINGISSFGYVLYNDRILIIFGGKVFGDVCVDSIYYLDICDSHQWCKSNVKCPIKGSYHAIIHTDIINNKMDVIHLFYCANQKEHFIININDIIHQQHTSSMRAKSIHTHNIKEKNISANVMNVNPNIDIDIDSNDNENDCKPYTAIWIDKQKLTAKSRIECTPFYLRDRDIIIYSAEYNLYDENQGGIYEYDNNLDTHRLIEKFELHKYYPSGHTCIYNRHTEEIIFIGGKNVKNNRKPYESMMIYDINNQSMTKILFKRAIGSDPKLLLIKNLLHIIGGSHNTYHLQYNLNSNELKPIYPFPYSNGLSGHGLIFCSANDTIITFGGAFYDYISCSYQFCNDYWIYNCVNNKYAIIYKKTLPQTINGFGYVLYNNRIIITFGGSIQRNKFIDNIYYTDVLNINQSWHESNIKCPKKGGYHAILLQNETVVHLIHFGKEQFCMNIHDLLPSSMHCSINDTGATQHLSKTNHSNNNLHCTSNILRAAQSVMVPSMTSHMNNDYEWKQLLMGYQSKIRALEDCLKQRDFSIAKYEQKLQMFEQCLKQKDFTIAKYEQKLQMFRHISSNTHKDVKTWNIKQIIDWIINLENGRFKRYLDELNMGLSQIMTSGDDLQYLTQQQIQSFIGINQSNDDTILYKYIQLLFN